MTSDEMLERAVIKFRHICADLENKARAQDHLNPNSIDVKELFEKATEAFHLCFTVKQVSKQLRQ